MLLEKLLICRMFMESCTGSVEEAHLKRFVLSQLPRVDASVFGDLT